MPLGYAIYSTIMELYHVTIHYTIGYLWVDGITKVKPDVNLVRIHPQLHPN